MTAKCNCKSPFQDKTYGPQIRLLTPILQKKGEVTSGTPFGRCTVCGMEKKRGDCTD